MKRKKINLPLILCAVFIAVLSCFACFRVAETNIVKADTSVADYTFNGSSIWVPHTILDNNLSRVRNSDNSFKVMYSNFMFTIKKTSDSSVSLNVSGSSLIENKMTRYYGIADVSLTNNETSFNLKMTEISVSNTYSFYIQFYISSNNINDFVPNIYRLREWYDWNSTNYLGGNHIRYYDVNDNYLDISITCYFQPVGVFSNYTDTPFGMTDRTYYFSNGIDFTDSQLYNQGYEQGLADNQQSIYESGYQAGQVFGRGQGYQEGLEDSNVYTFKNLIGASLDVPLNTFTSLFNFEILGVNLKDFLFAMFTICVVITIINLTRR